jgi:hypothetical protein
MRLSYIYNITTQRVPRARSSDEPANRGFMLFDGIIKLGLAGLDIRIILRFIFSISSGEVTLVTE